MNEEINRIEESIDALLDVLQEIISSGEEIPEELLQSAGDEIRLANERITQLQSRPVEANPPIGSDLIWILAGGDPEAFASYLQSIPDPALNALSQDPEQLGNLIERFQRQITISSGEAENGIARAPLQSSNIYGFRYDPRNNRLWVRFQSGSVYKYDDVPAQVFKMFQSGAIPAKTDGTNRHGAWWVGKIPSLGAAFYELIRLGGYPYQRLS